MRWFDDLWLKEGFAQYMAYKALAELEPAQNPWKHFYEEIKPAAYGIDETQGTTPIFQNIANLKDAKSAYGAIVYQKAPSVLKQLNYFLGEDNFRDGLRIYLKQHAYANARWSDLVGAFEQAAVDNKQPRDVQGWAKAWILQRGMPQVEAAFTCSAGKLKQLTLTQTDVLAANNTWPISNQILLGYRASSERLSEAWNSRTFDVKNAIGKPCPSYVFANAGDEAYGRFLLDPTSQRFVVATLSDRGGTRRMPDALLNSQLWGALWEDVRLARSSPLSFVKLARPELFVEDDESLLRIQAGRVSTALHSYLGPQAKAEVLYRIEATLFGSMTPGSSLGCRIVSFRAFTSIAETPWALQMIKQLLNGSIQVEGMPLKPLDRWNLIGHLIAMNDADAATLFAAEKAKDTSGEGQKYAYAVEAGTPSAAVKARYFDQYLHAADVQEDWITQSLRPFNGWNQTALTEPYLGRALDALPEIKQHRKIFFLGAWLGAFIDGQHSAEAQAVVHAWLAQAQLDPDLRLKVLEVSDALDRTVKIRTKFPEE
jgi:aminopeptidase N